MAMNSYVVIPTKLVIGRQLKILVASMLNRDVHPYFLIYGTQVYDHMILNPTFYSVKTGLTTEGIATRFCIWEANS